jgi:NADH-quinone oxidoreductase subunit M
MPKYAVVFLIMTMSSIGLPLLNGFIGEFTIMAGALQKNLWWAVAGGAGIVLGAAYMLWLYQRTMFGKLDNPANQNLPDMNWREWATVLPLIVMAFWIGLYPAPFFRALDKPVNKLVSAVQAASAAVPTPSAPAAAQAAGGGR